MRTKRPFALHVCASIVLGLCIQSDRLAGQEVTGLSDWTIYVDPGHSLKENMGAYGYSEAERNLGVALQLYDLLMSKTDIDTVYLSRDSQDDSIGLSDRSAEANILSAAWFHSLHSNAPSTTANDVLLLWGEYYSGDEKWPHGGQAMSDIMAPMLANGMRTDLWGESSGYNGSIGDCSFYTWSDWCARSGGPYLSVNRNTDMPSELSESGYHTNPVQNQRNMNYRWKRMEAYTFYWSILRYHGLNRPRVRILNGILYDMELGVPVNGAAVTAGGVTDTTDTYETLFHKYSLDPQALRNGYYFLEDVDGDTVDLVIHAPGYYPDTLQVAMVDTFFTFRDVYLLSNIPPKLVSTTPAYGDTAFPAWNVVNLRFSRSMNTTSVETTLVTPGNVGGSFSWSDGDRLLTFRPDSTLDYLTEYTLTISGQASDVHGHPFDGDGDGTGGDDFVLVFRTGPEDMMPPAIVRLYPLSSATGVELRPLFAVTYDEKIDSASVTEDQVQVLRILDQYFVPGQARLYTVGQQSVLHYFPTEDLLPGQHHTVRILPGLRDLLGNEETTIRFFSFTTGIVEHIATRIDNFDDGLDDWWQPTGSGNTVGYLPGTDRTASTTMTNLLTGSTGSLQLNYAWDPTASLWLIREYLSGGTPRTVHFDDSYIMQAYVFGDGSGNQIRFCVDDNVSELAESLHEVSPWFTIDWIGWRLVSWDMSTDGTGTWIGDGNLGGTLEFDSIQLTHVPGAAATGTIYIDDLRVVEARLLAVADRGALLPGSFVLHANYPNPFNPSTTIIYDVPRTARARLTIYNVLGKPVRTLVRGQLSPGRYQAVWDGKDDQGQPVASGLYIATLEAGGEVHSRKMVLSK